MEPLVADDGGKTGSDDVMDITFVFPADLYSFQGLAGRVRPAVGVFYQGGMIFFPKNR